MSHFNAHFERTFAEIHIQVKIDHKLSIKFGTERVQMIEIVYQSESLFNRKSGPSKLFQVIRNYF
jgi:hypothetical protein